MERRSERVVLSKSLFPTRATIWKLPKNCLVIWSENYESPRDFQFHLWKDDREIVVGQRWEDEIREGLKSCDAGLLLLSPSFLGSDYVTRVELPSFFADGKLLLPVMLESVDPNLQDVRGLDDNQIFSFHDHGSRDGIAYTECAETQKRNFAKALFKQIVTTLKKTVATERA